MAQFKKRKNKNGDTVWVVVVFLGTNAFGKREVLEKTIHGNKHDAQAWARQIEADRDKGLPVGIKHTVSVLLDDVLRDYEINGKRLDWARIIVEKHLRPYFGGMRIDKVTTEIVERFIVHRQGQKAANETINHDLAILRRGFHLGQRARKVGVVPWFSKLKVKNARKGFFEEDQYRAMLLELSEEIRPVLAMAYYTGCRRGEILSLQWSQVDLGECEIRLEPGTTKNDEARIIPLIPALHEMLKIQKSLRDQYHPECPWVFFRHASGEQVQSFQAVWEGASRRAGLIDENKKPLRLFHDLRRTGVRNLLRAGVPEKVAMAISGHKTRSVFDRYNIVSGRDLKDAARRLGDYMAEKEAEAKEAEAKAAPPSPIQ